MKIHPCHVIYSVTCCIRWPTSHKTVMNFVPCTNAKCFNWYRGESIARAQIKSHCLFPFFGPCSYHTCLSHGYGSVWEEKVFGKVTSHTNISPLLHGTIVIPFGCFHVSASSFKKVIICTEIGHLVSIILLYVQSCVFSYKGRKKWRPGGPHSCIASPQIDCHFLKQMGHAVSRIQAQSLSLFIIIVMIIMEGQDEDKNEARTRMKQGQETKILLLLLLYLYIGNGKKYTHGIKTNTNEGTRQLLIYTDCNKNSIT